MKEIPILFSGPMVKAILEGRKTQTRRVVKLNMAGRVQLSKRQWHIDDANAVFGCPYGQPGDRLWVRETWAAWSSIDDREADEVSGNCESLVERGISRGHISYRADPQMHADKWRPSIFMPRWASRITLEITVVRVERLQEISEVDAEAEGCPEAHLEHTEDCHHEHCALAGGVDDCCGYLVSAKLQYKALWESINGPGSWEANPFVWVVEFRRVN